MKVILIIAKEENNILALSIKKVIGLLAETETEICTHNNALAAFLSGNFTHVIILDYSEKESKSAGGFANYRDIKASAMQDQKIIRAGLERLNYADYWYLAGDLPKLFELLT